MKKPVTRLTFGVLAALIGAAVQFALQHERFQQTFLIFLSVGIAIAFVVERIQRRKSEPDEEKTLKETNKLIRQNEQALAYALEVGELGTWTLDLQTGRAQRSLRHDQIFGYPNLLPEWSYQTFLQHVLPSDRADVETRFGRALSSANEWHFECRIRRADGAIRWIEAQGKPQLKKNEVMQFVGPVKDITERKNVENKLQQFIEQSPFPVCMLDTEMRYLIASIITTPLLW